MRVTKAMLQAQLVEIEKFSRAEIMTIKSEDQQIIRGMPGFISAAQYPCSHAILKNEFGCMQGTRLLIGEIKPYQIPEISNDYLW